MLSFRAINSFHFRRSALLSNIARSHVQATKIRATKEFIDTKLSKSMPDFTMPPPLYHDGTSTAVTPVLTRQDARRVLKIMQAHPDAIWACDTEVADIDVKEQSPVGNGKVICVSIFGGEHINFGTGSTLWIENIGDSEDVLQEFKGFFEDLNVKKVWHNYGFDRHVMNNEKINCQGFHADTMHMARLWDTSRDKLTGGGEGYSLASLTEEFYADDNRFIKTKMMDIFGIPTIKKDGKPSKRKELPPMRNLQISPETREKWIEYSARDAFTTYHVYTKLAEKLSKMPWNIQATDSSSVGMKPSSTTGESPTQPSQPQSTYKKLGTMLDFYLQYWRNFGDLLTDLEKVGIQVDKDGHLKTAEQLARKERDKMKNIFYRWLQEQCPKLDIRNLNLQSSLQMSHLLFGQFNSNQERIRHTRQFEVVRSAKELEEARAEAVALNPYVLLTVKELKDLLKERGLTPLTGTRDVLMKRLIDDDEQAGLLKFKNPIDDETRKNNELTQELKDLKHRLFSPQFRYETLTVAQLKTLAKWKGMEIKKNLKKPELIAALRSHDETVDKLCLMHRGQYSQVNEKEIDSRLQEKRLFDGFSQETREKKVDVLVEFARRVSIYAAMPIEELLSMLKAEQQNTVDLKVADDWPEPMKLIHEQVANELISEHQQQQLADMSQPVSKPTPDDNLDDEDYIELPIEKEETFRVDRPTSKKAFSITTLGLKPLGFTPGGMPQVSAAVLKQLSGSNLDFSSIDLDNPTSLPADDDSKVKWGTAFEFFGGGNAGRAACLALGALAAAGQLDNTINNFLIPLQQLADSENRIHCSLNLNTETGRLSARRPNLQNQPALEKDQFKIRDAFIAPPGKTLIVADYGQLELRILAHITNCASMIQAFEQGGCFHSRTAVGMYDHVKRAVDEGKVLLEWDYSKGQPTVPLVKDTYAAERRKAKTLNFSIAYGKTVHGLAVDWGITKEEAEETLEAWYRDRPEVKEWQMSTQAMARKKGYVLTMMGRYRRLPDARQDMFTSSSAAGHALRAAINTPIQGSAADVVMMAMIKLWQSPTLKRLGWRLLLQIHDEVILEGPKESVNEAMKEVRHCMENPFDDFGLSKLRVHLDVDAKSADSWYKAK